MDRGGRGALALLHLQVALDVRYRESSHSHQLQHSFRRSLCNHKLRVLVMRNAAQQCIQGYSSELDKDDRVTRRAGGNGICTYCPGLRAGEWRGRSSGADRASI
jgi:hypothetical protein